MVNVYSGDNPSQLAFNALVDLYENGNTVAPRGKKVKELRPVIFEFKNPLNRVTFVKGRRVNPFFQQAEALWILAGRSDVKWLTKFNKNMAQFSDDGEYFNAPYGERLRFWGKNDYRNYSYNPYDQLLDVYEKLKADNDTRQAVASIYNPQFDNISYQGKDTPCNLQVLFKIRDNKLDITVFNRSNDLIYGTFGANLCQFATIQEVVASWLKIEVGTYYQVTDSLHTYLEDYGYKEADKIFQAYKVGKDDLTGTTFQATSRFVKHFEFENEPRITASVTEFLSFIDIYFEGLDRAIQDDSSIKNDDVMDGVLAITSEIPDDYFRNTVYSMIAYRGSRLDNFPLFVKAMKLMADSQWKLSCLYFMYNKYKDQKDFINIYAHYPKEMKAYIERRD